MATHDQHQQQVAGALDDLGVMLRSRPSVRDAVMQRVTEHAARNGPPAPTMMMRWAGRHPLSKLLALAACVLVALLIWSPWTRGIGATEAFAAAIANVAKARTFSCKQVVTEIGDDGKPQTRET